MAVKISKKVAPVVEDEVPAATAVVEAPEKPVGRHQVMLGNGAKRYGFKGVLYESGVKYNVSDGRRKELFERTDENGVRYFYDAAAVEASVKKALQRKRQQNIPMEVSPQQFASIMTEIADEAQDGNVQDGDGADVQV